MTNVQRLNELKIEAGKDSTRVLDKKLIALISLNTQNQMSYEKKLNEQRNYLAGAFAVISVVFMIGGGLVLRSVDKISNTMDQQLVLIQEVKYLRTDLNRVEGNINFYHR